MKLDTQFSIFLVNQAGVLSAVTTALAEAGVNLFALSLSDSGEHGVLRIVTDDTDKTREVLKETHDRWTETDVLLLPIGNEPGAFATLCHALAENRVNITYAYCTSSEGADCTTAIMKLPDFEKGMAVLKSLA